MIPRNKNIKCFTVYIQKKNNIIFFLFLATTLHRNQRNADNSIDKHNEDTNNNLAVKEHLVQPGKNEVNGTSEFLYLKYFCLKKHFSNFFNILNLQSN